MVSFFRFSLVVGNMTYNPVLKKWEGNDHVLRQFDTTSRNSRPALISNLGLKLPQVVGNMVFDPVQMRWIGNDEEMDMFADLESSDDDESTKSSIGTRWSLDPEFILTPTLCQQFEESERRHHEFIMKQRRFLDTTTPPLSSTTAAQDMMASMYLLRPSQTVSHHRQPPHR